MARKRLHPDELAAASAPPSSPPKRCNVSTTAVATAHYPSKSSTRPSKRAPKSQDPKPVISHPTHNTTPARATTKAERHARRPDRNIDKVVLGNICFDAWYASYYSKDVIGTPGAGAGAGPNTGEGGAGQQQHQQKTPMLDRLYVCPSCFKYSKELVSWWKHVHACERQRQVPGRKIYIHPKSFVSPKAGLAAAGASSCTRSHKPALKGGTAAVGVDEDTDEGEWSVWEVDGEEDRILCQNLSLFAKLFLDTKSIFFNVQSFKYFLLVYTPPSSPAPLSPPSPPSSPQQPPSPSPSLSFLHTRPQIVGFFSKEKVSWDNNNLACILIFPPWQRKGLGALLMGISYEIARRERLLGGPEKPISDLGLRGYRRYWTGEVARWLMSLKSRGGDDGERHDDDEGSSNDDDNDDDIIFDVHQCSRDTWIAPEDCLFVLRDMCPAIATIVDGNPPSASAHIQSQPQQPLDAYNTPKPDDDDSASNSGSDVDHDPDTTVACSTSTSSSTSTSTARESAEQPRLRLSKRAVYQWTLDRGISLAPTCDLAGFVDEKYGYRTVDGEEGEDREGGGDDGQDDKSDED